MLFSVAAFLVVLALLAGQLRTASGHRAARPVIVIRRIYRTTVLETLVGTTGAGRASGGASSVTQSVSSSGSGPALPSGPTTRSS